MSKTSTTSPVLDDFRAFIARYVGLKAKLIEEGKVLFFDAVKNIFKAIPDLTCIKWSQYTPYFMDGDPCVFMVNNPIFSNYPIVKEVTIYGSIDSPNFDDTIYWTYAIDHEQEGTIPTTLVPLFSEFSNLITSDVFEPVLEDMFGDHVCVICTRTNISSEPYDHE